MTTRNILWLLFCLCMLLVGSAIITLICHALHLPTQLGTLFGMFLGFALFIFYTEKVG